MQYKKPPEMSGFYLKAYWRELVFDGYFVQIEGCEGFTVSAS